MTTVLDEPHLTVITTGRSWDPITATHGTNHHPMPIAARENKATHQAGGRGEPTRH